jgi:peptidoglycan hydrolase-like protein with peptidoglycan-binding domain
MNTIKKYISLTLVIGAIMVSGFAAHANESMFGSETLRLGATGPYVINVQNALNAKLGLHIVADGKYGRKTVLAVQTLQRMNHLRADGSVGVHTRQLFDENITPIVPGSPITTAAPQQCTQIPIVSLSSGTTTTVQGFPAVQVISPLAGAVFHVGDTVTVQWKNCHVYNGFVSISIVASNGLTSLIASNIDISKESFQIVIPASVISSTQSNYTFLLATDSYTNSSANHISSGSVTILPQQTPSVPIINSIDQVSGSIGTMITLTGSGFSSTDTVLFGTGPVSGSVVSRDGSHISFKVPAGVGADCNPDQACPMYLQVVTLGNYSISVRNTNGISNSVVFAVTGTNQY